MHNDNCVLAAHKIKQNPYENKRQDNEHNKLTTNYTTQSPAKDIITEIRNGVCVPLLYLPLRRRRRTFISISLKVFQFFSLFLLLCPSVSSSCSYNGIRNMVHTLCVIMPVQCIKLFSMFLLYIVLHSTYTTYIYRQEHTKTQMNMPREYVCFIVISRATHHS